MEAEKEQERSESRGTDGRSNLGSTSSIMSRSPMAVDENEGRKQKTPPSDDHGNKTTETPKKQKLCSTVVKSPAQRLSSAPLVEVFTFTIEAFPESLSLPRLSLVCKSWNTVARNPNLWMIAYTTRFPRAFKLSLKKLREETADESKGGKKSKGDDKNTDSDDMKIKIDGSGKEARNSSTEGGTSTQSGSGGSSMETEGETTEETEEKLGGEESDVSDSEEKEEEELDKMPPATPAEIRVIMRSSNARTRVETLTKQAVIYKKAARHVEEMRQKGNEKFKEGKLEDALRTYHDGFERGEKALTGPEDDAAPVFDRIELRHLLAILYSNCSAAWYRLKEFERAAKWGVRAHERLLGITLVMKDRSAFALLFGELNRKIQKRIRQALQHVIPRISLVRHSDVPVEGVGVGTILRSNRDMGGSIFDDSSVILYQHERGEGCQGIVLNKRATMPDGKTRRMGGPVDPTSEVYLHNVPDLPDAKRVMEGVYWGGDIEEAKRREGARIETFYGYAAWFDGQLDGEIRNEDWTWTNDVD